MLLLNLKDVDIFSIKAFLLKFIDVIMDEKLQCIHLIWPKYLSMSKIQCSI